MLVFKAFKTHISPSKKWDVCHPIIDRRKSCVAVVIYNADNSTSFRRNRLAKNAQCCGTGTNQHSAMKSKAHELPIPKRTITAICIWLAVFSFAPSSRSSEQPNLMDQVNQAERIVFGGQCTTDSSLEIRV